MKTGIHPDYKPTTIVCSCGNTIETRSTQENIHVEICSVCHPFYTGKQKLVDTAGRVERFKRKYGDTGVDQEAVEEAVEAGVEVGEPVEEEGEDASEGEGAGESSAAGDAPAAKAEDEPDAEEEKAEG